MQRRCHALVGAAAAADAMLPTSSTSLIPPWDAAASSPRPKAASPSAVATSSCSSWAAPPTVSSSTTVATSIARPPRASLATAMAAILCAAAAIIGEVQPAARRRLAPALGRAVAAIRRVVSPSQARAAVWHNCHMLPAGHGGIVVAEPRPARRLRAVAGGVTAAASLPSSGPASPPSQIVVSVASAALQMPAGPRLVHWLAHASATTSAVLEASAAAWSAGRPATGFWSPSATWTRASS